jgi:hypothetical protein
MKPKSGSDVYAFMWASSRRWFNTADIVRGALTVNPSARLSELCRKKLVKKRPCKEGGAFKVEYAVCR